MRMESPLAAWCIDEQPYYQPAGREVELFEAACLRRMPVMLKGPTGCGKTRLVEYMAWRLGKPLITVACNDDLSASDLVGRWILDAEGTRWQDGPLSQAARFGAICYLDELVEARSDTAVVIHPLTDSRRMLPLAARNELLQAHPDFMLVVSYNPGPASREMKASTRQRFCALSLGYPTPELEALIVAQEAQIDQGAAKVIVGFGVRTRRLQGEGLDEGASTRMLVRAGELVAQGLRASDACRMALVEPLTDDADTRMALEALLDSAF
jgi:nitric oxide reductase NorQ protein